MQSNRRQTNPAITFLASVRLSLSVIIATVLIGSFCLPASAADDASVVLYNRDVRPILSENCFFCHGFDEANRKSGLRLDTREGSTADLGGYQAIVPGDAHASEIMARVHSDDPDLRMPPTDSAYTLTDEQRQTLRRWINEGAEYQEHWAYTRLERPDVPGGVDKTQAIDKFLERRWQQEEATVSPEASPRTRLRRLSYDLRGLPPTYEEVQAFEADPSPQHLKAFIDRWMASLEYAEQQAVAWLDLVRWADTSGMVSDEPIASGAYRAYVIESIHRNKPFNQFSIEQLAGDLLPNPTDETLIASGYNRLVKTNCEAGVIEKEALYALKGEHVRAVGTVWLGSTTGCCECHDHKYDPFLAKDYYSLAAFFDDLVETGVYTPGDRRPPLHFVHDKQDDAKRDETLALEYERLKADIQHPNSELDAQQPAWETKISAVLKDKKARAEFNWIPALPLAAWEVEGDFEQTTHAGRAARVVAAEKGVFKRHLVAETMAGYFTRGEVFKTDEDGFYVDVYLDPKAPPRSIVVQILHGAYGRLGWKPEFDETYVWGPQTSGWPEKNGEWASEETTKRLGNLPEVGKWVRLRIPRKDLVKQDKWNVVGMAWAQDGGVVAWGDSGLQLSKSKVTELTLAEPAMRKWFDQPYDRHTYEKRHVLTSEAIKVAPEKRTELQNQLVREAFREQSQPGLLAKLRNAERLLFDHRRKAVPVLVSKSGQPKTTRLVNRGNFMDTTGPIVSPAIPEFLGSLDTGGKRATRLDFAKWIFSDENPLTARVYVNRLWAQFYGRGISETLEDSGSQGDWPSHPDLLDWLACEFRDSGWNQKHLVKLLVTSKAYGLSSKPVGEMAAVDPSNRLHARQGRHRHTAEEIRDTALAVAGLLCSSDTIPPESFFPYQPERYWNQSNKVMYGSRNMLWETSKKKSQYHRTLYTFWKRQNVHPTLLAFDAPTRQECTARRTKSNTPGQALALLNDPMFIEAARALAERTLAETATAADADQSGIRFAFQQTLQRLPSNQELEVLLSFLQQERTHYAKHQAAASELLEIGQQPLTSSLPHAEVAAWTSLSRSLLNLHEFLTRS